MPLRSRRRALEASSRRLRWCSCSCRVLNDTIGYQPVTYFHILLAAFHCRRSTLLARALAASTALRLIVYAELVIRYSQWHAHTAGEVQVHNLKECAPQCCGLRSPRCGVPLVLPTVRFMCECYEQRRTYKHIGHRWRPVTAVRLAVCTLQYHWQLHAHHCHAPPVAHAPVTPPPPVPSPMRRSAVLQAVAP